MTQPTSIEQLKQAVKEKYKDKAERLMNVQSTISNYRLSPEDLDETVTSTYLQAHQAGIDEAVEIVQSVRIEGNNRHANDKTEDQRDYLNDWILPAVKKEIIKALQDNK